MNTLYAIIVHRYFKEPFFNGFAVSIDNCNVVIERTIRPEAVEVSITGRKGEGHLRELFFEIIDLFFMYLGSCPTPETILVNNVVLDRMYYSDRYVPSSKYGKLLAVCDISADTINDTTIQKRRNFELEPFFSLEFLLSSGYDNLNIVHRIVLFLQVMEGIVSDSQRVSVKSELQILSKKTNNPGQHSLSVYYICKNCFFCYHKKYNCEILKLLGFSRREFIKSSTDTRNWYSHYLNETREQHKIEKKTPLTDGSEMLYFFEILFFAMRIHLCGQLDVDLKENNIKESYYRIHDWIMTTKYGRDDDLKSWAYSINKAINDIEAKLDATSKIQRPQINQE